MSDRIWDQLSELEQLQSTYSDVHKDVYGFRPSDFGGASVEWLKAELERLYKSLERHLDEEAEMTKVAIATFGELVASVMGIGAKNREDAIRWILESNECVGDEDYFCYLTGLPYGYFKKVA